MSSASRPKVIVTGANGQLGCELAAALQACANVISLDRAALDLSDPDAIRAALRAHAPDLVVNAAAYTDVDRAETDGERAFAVNAMAPGVLAEHTRAAGTLLVHWSTDYVFDGDQRTPYAESAIPRPLNAYGASKLAGEAAIRDSGAAALIFRTSWVYGLRGRNFLMTIRRLAAMRDELRIVADQAGTPNWCRELARVTATLIARGLPYLRERCGLYHLSARGATTWFDFARAIVGDVPRPRVVPITTAEYPTPARRPVYGVLDSALFERTFGLALPDWRRSLADCMNSPAEPPGGAQVACPPPGPPGR